MLPEGFGPFARLPLFVMPALCLVSVPLSAQERVFEVSRRAERSLAVPLVFDGMVFDPSGAAVEGAVVRSSTGGKTTTDARGAFRLETTVPLGDTGLEVTAEFRTEEGGLRGTAAVDLRGRSPRSWVGAIELVPAGCVPTWVPTFGQSPGVPQSYAAAVFDDGNGAALYAEGVKWDGERWSQIVGFEDPLPPFKSMAVFDDGNGPDLYVGGEFLTVNGENFNNIVRWDGSSWSSVGAGFNGTLFPYVWALKVFDDGTGSKLYAAGRFLYSDGRPMKRIACWDGTEWTKLGSGLNERVQALAVFDDGTGPALYAGGWFTMAGGAPANHIAKWDGTQWSTVGDGLDDFVFALEVFDDGTGPALYAGCWSPTPGGQPLNHVVKWDGSSWSPVPGSFPDENVLCFAVFDDGAGPRLHVGTTSSLLRLEGSTWNPLVSDARINALTEFDDGTGPALYAVGSLSNGPPGSYSENIFRWDGAETSQVGVGLNGPVFAMAESEESGKKVLYLGGWFTSVGDMRPRRVGRWDGDSWAELGSGLDDIVMALDVLDTGSGPALHAGGYFTHSGSVSANRIASWDGTGWSPLGSGFDDGYVSDLAVLDEGSGPALVACGTFTTSGSTVVNRIARFDGTSWSSLGGGMNGDVHTLAMFDDGGGSALYAGGSFTSAGGAAASRVARWSGSAWVPLGTGMNDVVSVLFPYDDGSGPALYAGGRFTVAGGVPANCVARWDGSSWSPLADGFETPWVLTLEAFDDGNGMALYAGGSFSTAGGQTKHLAKWDGLAWSPLVGSYTVVSLRAYDDGGGPALFVGAGNDVDSFLTKLDGCLKRLDFEREDDFETALANGQDLSSPAEFGNLVSIRGTGPNAHAAVFDSTPGGPNAAGPDPDLLVGSGNVLILQDDNDAAQGTPGFFDQPDDDPDGGMLRFVFRGPVGPRSVDLVDLDAGSGLTLLTQIDLHGRRRVHTIPANWTGDLLLGGAGRLTLDLTTLAAQPGFGSIATAVDDPGFEPGAVVTIEVRLGGSGALDNLAFGPAQAPLGSGPRIGPR